MTAEIVIMNKEAIAIATDSAVTISEEFGEKIFTSVNKIFTLSKYHSVGIIIYGNASFMGVPWEVIIKIFRKKLGKKKFDTLKEYGEYFINFLDKEKNQFFPKSEQKKYFEETVYSYFAYILGDIRKKVEEIISENDQISNKEIKEITTEIIYEHYTTWKNAEYPTTIPKSYTLNLKKEYGAIIEEIKEKIFEKLPITKTLSNQLKEIAANLFIKFPETVFHSAISGVVITGFGEKEIFPTTQSYLIGGMVGNVLKYKIDEYGTTKITIENDAAIVPFAQKEMVTTFIEGVDPNYEMAIETDMSKIFEQYPKIIIDSVKKLNEKEKSKLMRKLNKISEKRFQEYKEKLQKYRTEHYVAPIVQVVAMLPKDELAMMAKSLVNLTLFKRRISMEAETVAGPIDVAVISKGDGFVWIERKHYFKPELNPHFFTKYYMEV